MKLKRYVAKDMRTALASIKAELGADAIIMSNKKIAGGVEIMAAVDYDPMAEQQASPAAQPVQQPDRAPISRGAKTANLIEQAMQRRLDDDQVSIGGNAAAKPAPQFRRPAQAQPDEAASQPASSLQAILQRQKQRQVQPEAAPAHAHQSAHATQAAHTAGPELGQEMQQMRSDMATMRQLLEFQLSDLMDQHLARKEPIRAMLIEKLKKMGIHQQVADQMACFIPEELDPEQAFEEVLEMLAGQLHSTNDDIMRRGGVVALMGPTGVGKTTTIAKLAARFAQTNGADSVAMITTDTYRIGAHEQLATYGKIIGCPVKVAKDAEELQMLLDIFADKKLVLIDTAGMSQRDRRLTEHLAQLIKNSHIKIKSYLVLSATSQQQVLEDAVAHFKQVSLSGCIFTKLDEAISLGEVISTAILHALPVGYVTDGQRVPEDLDVAVASELVNLAQERNLCYQSNSNLGFVPQAVTM